MKKNYIWIKLSCNKYNYFFNIIKKNNIDILDNKLKNNDYIIKVSEEDYKKIITLFGEKYVSIYKYSGMKSVENKILNNILFIIIFFISFLFLIIMNHTIIKINVITSDNDIKKLIVSELNKYNIKPLSFKYNHKKIEKIVDNILNDTKDNIKWMEMSYDGVTLNVYATKVIKNKEEISNNYCNIITKKDARIISLNIKKGEIIKEINDYVNKGDIIISGDILYNQEIKNHVCSDGIVYGEVYYLVKVKVPLNDIEKKYTNKNRYNIEIINKNNKYRLFKDRILKYTSKNINIFKLNDFKIDLVKDSEYKEVNKKLTEKEAYDKALKIAEEKINIKLLDDEEILFKKVLKKSVFDSTIYLEIFVVTKENIGQLNILKEDVVLDE